MSKIPMVGHRGTTWINVPDKNSSPTPDDRKVLDELSKKCDENIGRVYMEKMIALGYQADLETGVRVYKNREESRRIDEEYFELQKRNLWNGAFASLENILRGTEY